MIAVAVIGAALLLSGTGGTPLAKAAVTFVDRGHHRTLKTSDAAGVARAPSNFDAVRALVRAAGYDDADVRVEEATQRVLLTQTLPVIGSVRVATLSPQSLHLLPVPAAALDHSAITLRAATTADAMLRALPGFDPVRSNSAFTNYGQLRASFAGAGNDRGLVLVDGVPAQDGFGGQIDWQAYPPNNIQSAELLRGVGSALYGGGAIGGALDLRTYGPDVSAATPQTQVTVSAGSDAFSEEWLNMRTRVGSKASTSLSAEQQRSSYADLAPGYQSSVDHAATARSGAVSLRARYEFSPNDALEIGERIASDTQDEGRPNYTLGRNLNQFDARLSHMRPRGAAWLDVFARNAFVVNSTDAYPSKPGALRYIQDIAVRERGAAGNWVVDSGSSAFAARADGRWIRGAAYQYGAGGAAQSAVAGTQNRGGFGVQETLRSPRLETIMGARIDRLVSPRAALRYLLSPTWNLRASGGSGFREPFLNELLRSFFIGNVQYQANHALSPERSWTLSGGADWSDGRTRVSADVVHTHVRDAIAFRTIDAEHQQRSNIAQTQTDGATFTLTRALSTDSRLTIAVTAQHARVINGPRSMIGKRLQFVADTTGTIAYQTSKGSFRAGFDFSYLGQAYADDLNRQPLGTAWVGDGRVQIPVGSQAALIVSATNIFSARYRSSIDRLGPPAVLSVAVTFTP